MLDLTLEEYLAVPYMLVVESVPLETGEWTRHASYPELDGCMAEGTDLIEVINSLEELREGIIRDRLRRNEAVPVPRPPLSDGYQKRWLPDGTEPFNAEEETPYADQGRE